MEGHLHSERSCREKRCPEIDVEKFKRMSEEMESGVERTENERKRVRDTGGRETQERRKQTPREGETDNQSERAGQRP